MSGTSPRGDWLSRLGWSPRAYTVERLFKYLLSHWFLLIYYAYTHRKSNLSYTYLPEKNNQKCILHHHCQWPNKARGSSRRSTSSGLIQWSARHSMEPWGWQREPKQAGQETLVCLRAVGLKTWPPSEPLCGVRKDREALTQVRLTGLRSLQTGILALPYSGWILSYSRTDHTYLFTTTSSVPAVCPTGVGTQ